LGGEAEFLINTGGAVCTTTSSLMTSAILEVSNPSSRVSELGGLLVATFFTGVVLLTFSESEENDKVVGSKERRAGSVLKGAGVKSDRSRGAGCRRPLLRDLLGVGPEGRSIIEWDRVVLEAMVRLWSSSDKVSKSETKIEIIVL
jgi:hypothetical protein